MPEPHFLKTALEGSTLFAGLSEPQLREVAGLAQQRDFANGQLVIRKNAAPTEFFALLEGEARVMAPAADGQELYLRTLRAGDVFGEIGLFDQRPRTASVETTCACRMAAFDVRDLRDYLRHNPEVALQLLRIFAERLRDTTQLLEDQVFLNSGTRLAKVLISLANEYGEEAEDAGSILIGRRFTQGTLAQMVGTTREGVNRQITAWEHAGILKRESNLLRILDRSTLESLLPPGEY